MNQPNQPQEEARSERVRFLRVEDAEDDALLLLMELRRGGYAPEHRIVQTEKEMREALCAGSCDLIISDYVMPGFTGLRALALLQELDLDTPFIIVSGLI